MNFLPKTCPPTVCRHRPLASLDRDPRAACPWPWLPAGPRHGDPPSSSKLRKLLLSLWRVRRLHKHALASTPLLRLVQMPPRLRNPWQVRPPLGLGWFEEGHLPGRTAAEPPGATPTALIQRPQTPYCTPASRRGLFPLTAARRAPSCGSGLAVPPGGRPIRPSAWCLPEAAGGRGSVSCDPYSAWPTPGKCPGAQDRTQRPGDRAGWGRG